MGNPAQRGKRGSAAILNQNPFFEMASSVVSANMLQNDCHSRAGGSPAQSHLDSRLRGNDE